MVTGTDLETAAGAIMHVVRRHYWDQRAQPELLMPCMDPLWLLESPRTLAEITGIDADAIPVSTVSAIPVPVAEDGWVENGLRRWDGTRPEAMWLPLMWLPPRLAAPKVARLPDGTLTEEPLALWQARVTYEILDAELYTSDGWVDVLHMIGIDTGAPEGLDRVSRWLDGEADEALDSFTLDTWFHNDPTDWASELAVDTVPLLMAGSKALMSDTLLALAFELTDPDINYDDASYARAAWWLGALSVEAVADAEDTEVWSRLIDQVKAAGEDRDQLAEALRPSLGLLTVHRDRNWPALEKLQSLVGPDRRDGGPGEGGQDDDEPDQSGPGNTTLRPDFEAPRPEPSAPPDPSTELAYAGRRPQARW